MNELRKFAMEKFRKERKLHAGRNVQNGSERHGSQVERYGGWLNRNRIELLRQQTNDQKMLNINRYAALHTDISIPKTTQHTASSTIKRTNMSVDAGCAAAVVVVGAGFDDMVDCDLYVVLY